MQTAVTHARQRFCCGRQPAAAPPLPTPGRPPSFPPPACPADFGSVDQWADYLRRAGVRLRVHPQDTGGGAADLSGVEFAICWNPPPGLLQQVHFARMQQCLCAASVAGLGSRQCTYHPASYPAPLPSPFTSLPLRLPLAASLPSSQPSTRPSPARRSHRLQCPNLRAIQSMGAGVDSMIGEPTLPRHVPLLRVIDPLMSERMATWVLWGVINCQVRARALLEGGLTAPSCPHATCISPAALHAPRNAPYHALPCLAPMLQRKCDAYLAAQRQRLWDKGIENFRNTDNSELRVGIMGLGEF